MGYRFIFCMFMACLLVGACGIRPGALQPPEHVEEDKFPQTYPSPDLNRK